MDGEGCYIRLHAFPWIYTWSRRLPVDFWNPHPSPLFPPWPLICLSLWTVKGLLVNIRSFWVFPFFFFIFQRKWLFYHVFFSLVSLCKACIQLNFTLRSRANISSVNSSDCSWSTRHCSNRYRRNRQNLHCNSVPRPPRWKRQTTNNKTKT